MYKPLFPPMFIGNTQNQVDVFSSTIFDDVWNTKSCAKVRDAKDWPTNFFTLMVGQ